MSGGEPFSFPAFASRIVPGLVERTAHTVSVLTNLSAPPDVLARFAENTRGRLGIVSASLHLESAGVDEFVKKALVFRTQMDEAADFVVNSVLVPGRLDEVSRVRDTVEAAGLRFFPQVMKAGKGIYPYSEETAASSTRSWARVRALVFPTGHRATGDIVAGQVPSTSSSHRRGMPGVAARRNGSTRGSWATCSEGRSG